jgi:pimeloyl-ACP methyl ester carboxylesterase
MKAIINQIKMGFETLGWKQTPLVLIHGFGLDRSIWREMVRQYMVDQMVILPDMRGHGESDTPGTIATMSQMAEDVVDLLDYLGIERAIICGHSMGGYVSLAFVEQNPERMAGLVLITTRADSDSDEKKVGRYQLVEYVKEKGSVALAETLAPRLSKDKKVIETSYRLINQANPQGIIAAALGMAERRDYSYLLKKIDCPALVVAGEEDQIIPMEMTEAMVKQLKEGTLLKVTDAGHMPMLENPKLLAEGLLAFINRVETEE